MGWADRPGQQAGCVAGWAGPEPSLRHVREAWPEGHGFQYKKAVIFDKADEPRKFQGPPDRILDQPTWVGGGGGQKKQIQI